MESVPVVWHTSLPAIPSPSPWPLNLPLSQLSKCSSRSNCCGGVYSTLRESCSPGNFTSKALVHHWYQFFTPNSESYQWSTNRKCQRHTDYQPHPSTHKFHPCWINLPALRLSLVSLPQPYYLLVNEDNYFLGKSLFFAVSHPIWVIKQCGQPNSCRETLLRYSLKRHPHALHVINSGIVWSTFYLETFLPMTVNPRV